MTRYSRLRGFARDVGHQFAMSADYFACMAWDTETPVIMIDLLNETILPAWFRIPRNEILVHRCSTTLKRNVESSAPVPAVLKRAELEMVLDLSGPASGGVAPPRTLRADVVVGLTGLTWPARRPR